VTVGKYSETINHYNVLATIENMYGLTAVGGSADANVISDIWSS
jgi:phosphatidylinositol-3-phosphatase